MTGCYDWSRGALVGLSLFSGTAWAQPEVRVYADIYEVVGLSAGYGLSRTRFELTGGFRVDHASAADYIEEAHPWPSFAVASAAHQTFSDNTWQENTTTVTTRVLRWRKRENMRFKWYYGAYIRCLMRSASPDRDGWSTAEENFMNNNRMPVYKKYVNVFGGLILGARGTIAGNFFWDFNAGLKLIPFFYEYSRLEYNDGTEDRQSYTAGGYQYSAPGDNILQVGFGYQFVPKPGK